MIPASVSPNTFNFAATPHIHFGAGERAKLKGIASSFASDENKGLLLVTGGYSFDASAICADLLGEVSAAFAVHRIRVEGEPSPQLVDAAVAEFHAFKPCCVIAIGGGSAVDAGKAIAGLLPLGESVMEYLEGVGKGRR